MCVSQHNVPNDKFLVTVSNNLYMWHGCEHRLLVFYLCLLGHYITEMLVLLSACTAQLLQKPVTFFVFYFSRN